jgi:predicted signal transduction protein with EAL and GGDEF domain
MVARLGGDEFAVIVRNVAGDDDAPALFRILSEALARPFDVLGTRVVVSCSAGIASYPEGGVDVDALLMRADAAMHTAKDRGRACCQLFVAEIQDRLERRLDVESRLRGALASGSGLELHYQPKVEVPSGRVRGVEALLRWTAGQGASISPPELVSVAEETGLMVALGDWVLRAACLQAKAWSLGPHPLRVAVNISARQFRATDFAEKVASLLTELKLSPDLLELEITEGVMMADSGATGRMLEQLKLVGVHVALDDFGTGFSSLAYLTRFPVDVLKIDRSFVIEIGVTAKSEAIVGAIVALARSLDIEIVAEGVETEAQRRFLEGFGAMQIQGWLFAKALRPAELMAWLLAHTGAYDARVDIAS